MDFRMVLARALTACGERADDPFLLYCMLCDEAKSDLILLPQIETFNCFNQACRLVSKMRNNPAPKMITLLLDECKKQPDASEKQCLKWIHTIFEFYYRAKHGAQTQTEQILQSLEADLFEPEQEGLELPKPKPKQKKSVAKCTPKANAKAPAPAKAAIPPRTNKPRVQKKPSHAPNTITVVPVVDGKAPCIPNLKPVAPFALPGSLYKILPDDAIVYVASTPHIHLSAQCPCLGSASVIRKGLYSRARENDFFRMYNFRDAQTAAHHVPPLCKTCGDFTPVLASRAPNGNYQPL